jgi:hypothetical protein
VNVNETAYLKPRITKLPVRANRVFIFNEGKFIPVIDYLSSTPQRHIEEWRHSSTFLTSALNGGK